MREHTHWLLLTPAVFALFLACKEDNKEKSPSEAASSMANAAASGAATTAQAKGLLSETAKFAKDMTKKGCELLTADDVSKAFGVPADELKRHKVMGCIYTWKGADETVEARLSLLMVHKSEKSAATWFQNATKNVSAEEAQKTVDYAMKRVKEKAQKGELGKKVSPGAVDTVGKTLTGVVDPKGNRYEDVAGLGDEARVQLENGSIWIRVDNLTFSVAGYKGKPQPKAELPRGDLKDIAAKAQAAQRAFFAETFDQRKADATKVAKLVLGAL